MSIPPYYLYQKNVMMGQRNTLRVLLSLITAVDEELMDRIVDKLDSLDEDGLERVATSHGKNLGMSVVTVRRHLDKLMTGAHFDIIWPTISDLDGKEKEK
jgi:hypothetical protein